MNVDIIGVVEDGSPRDEQLAPWNPRRTLRVIKGTTFTVRAQLRTAAGIPVDLSGVARTVVFTLKRHSDDGHAVASITATKVPGQLGRADILLSAASLRNAPPGRYVYDVVFTDTSLPEVSAVVPLSTFILEAGVTPAPSV
jgi:hypothetical protein